MNSPDQKALPQLGCVFTGIRVFFGYIFPYIFVVAGAISLIFGARQLQDAKESEDWPTAGGTILSVAVKKHTTRHSSGSGPSRSSTSWAVDVEYEFEVDGAKHQGDRLAFGQVSFNKRREAQAKADEYPEGREVKVYYNPEDLSKSCLETGIKTGVWILLGLGTVFFVVGTIMSIVLPRFFRGLTGKVAAAIQMAAKAQQNDGRPDAV